MELNSFGLDQIPDSTIDVIRGRMKDYPALASAVLKFNQNRSKNLDNMRYMSQLRFRDSLDLLSQAEKIIFLENKVRKLAKYEALQIPFEELTKEVEINYEHVDRISYSSVISSDFKKLDTIAEFTVKWKKAIKNDAIAKEQNKLQRWLKQKYKLDTLVLKRVN